MSTSLLFLAPALVTLPLKVDSLVESDRAAANLSLIAGVGAIVAMISNPVFGRLSDRTTSRYGMRRPWMIGGAVGGTVGIAIVAAAPTIPVVLVGWCIVQMLFNALLAAQAAVLPDQVPPAQRGTVSGILGVALPVASVLATFLVQLVSGNQFAMFMLPCAVGGAFVFGFAITLKDRKLDPLARPPWSIREVAGTFGFDPRRNPDFAWVFSSRFLLVLAYAFLATFQTFYLLNHLGTSEDDVPRQVFLGTLAQSIILIGASLASGRLSDRWGRRKVFVAAASITYGFALFVIAVATSFDGFVVGMAISGLGFGMYMAVDLALAVDVLPSPRTSGKDLGVLNVASALPFAVAPALAPFLLALGNGSYSFLFVVAGLSAVIGAALILPIRAAR